MLQNLVGHPFIFFTPSLIVIQRRNAAATVDQRRTIQNLTILGDVMVPFRLETRRVVVTILLLNANLRVSLMKLVIGVLIALNVCQSQSLCLISGRVQDSYLLTLRSMQQIKEMHGQSEANLSLMGQVKMCIANLVQLEEGAIWALRGNH